MARTGDGGNEYSPKYRIVGAVIVVFIGFILLSNLLKDKESPESPQTVTGVNERPGATNEVYNASLAETQANTPPTTGTANDTTRTDAQAPAATAAPPRVEAVAANTDHGAGEATVAPASAANTHATAAPARRVPAAANDSKGGWVSARSRAAIMPSACARSSSKKVSWSASKTSSSKEAKRCACVSARTGRSNLPWRPSPRSIVRPGCRRWC
jgi:cytoskeletal protein RodZ